MTGAPAFSVVIPTFNRLSALKEVLEALDGQEGPAFEILVVNDGSSDGTTAWLDQRVADRPDASPALRVIHQQNQGPAVARNRGVTAARGRWVAFLGDDTVPSPGWLAAHDRVQNGDLARSVRASGGCVGVIGRTDWHSRMRRTPFLDYINEQGLQFGFALIEDEDNVPFNFFYTSNLSVDRDAMAAEPFDQAFPFAAWEDVEAGYRLAARGLRLLYRPAAHVAHDHPTDLARFAERQYRSGYSAVVFYRRHEQLEHFLGMQNGRPPSAGGAGERTLLWAQERLARALQGMPVRLPRLWEKTMRHHYLEGLRNGWSDGVGLDRGGRS
ncbi:MAG: glycosyltransferase family A protein [Acidobacteria bacterium]|nr:glycosyltransferase family A protein [Acidobacteriota bacterium]